MKRSNSNKNSLLVIGIILVLVISGIFIYLFLNTKNSQEGLSLLKLSEEDKTKYNKWDNVIDHDSVPVFENLEYKNKEIKITYTKTINNDSEMFQSIRINDKLVKIENFSCGGPSIPVIANGMVFVGYHEGCDIFGDSLEIYDFEGNLVDKYEYIDSTVGMRLSGFEIKDGVLYLDGTRGTHGPSILTSKDDREGYYICSDEDLNKGNIKDSDILSATYKVEYKGNYKFSDIKIVDDKVTTVGEEKNTSCSE